MLYWLLVPLRKYMFFFNVFRYITVRTALGGMTALLFVFIFLPVFIKVLRKHQIGQEIREEGPSTHLSKKGTPSMGGVIIIGATVVSTLLWGNLGNIYVWLGLAGLTLFGLIGFIDDFIKYRSHRSLGLNTRQKLILQITVSGLLALILVLIGFKGKFDLHLTFPFIKEWTLYLGWLYLPWILFILVGSSNAVNLADGLDGLAIG